MCQQGLKLSTTLVLPTMCDSVPLIVSGHVEAELSHKGSSQHNKGQINIASSDSEVEIVGVQEKAR